MRTMSLDLGCTQVIQNDLVSKCLTVPVKMLFANKVTVRGSRGHISYRATVQIITLTVENQVTM